MLLSCYRQSGYITASHFFPSRLATAVLSVYIVCTICYLILLNSVNLIIHLTMWYTSNCELHQERKGGWSGAGRGVGSFCSAAGSHLLQQVCSAEDVHAFCGPYSA